MGEEERTAGPPGTYCAFLIFSRAIPAGSDLGNFAISVSRAILASYFLLLAHFQEGEPELEVGVGDLHALGILLDHLVEIEDGPFVVLETVEAFPDPVTGVVGELAPGKEFQELLELGPGQDVLLRLVGGIGVPVPGFFVLPAGIQLGCIDLSPAGGDDFLEGGDPVGQFPELFFQSRHPGEKVFTFFQLSPQGHDDLLDFLELAQELGLLVADPGHLFAAGVREFPDPGKIRIDPAHPFFQ